jgi:hypothetical protein
MAALRHPEVLYRYATAEIAAKAKGLTVATTRHHFVVRDAASKQPVYQTDRVTDLCRAVELFDRSIWDAVRAAENGPGTYDQKLRDRINALFPAHVKKERP